jgi:ABC-2 type transport system permease protein
VFALYRRLVAYEIRSQMQYRVPFLLDSLASFMATFIGFATLALILQRFENIAGWDLGEVAFLYGTVETSFGIMDLLFSGFDPPSFGRQVRLGTFDQMLLRPVNITLQVFASNVQMRRFGRIAQGILVLAVAISLLDIHWTVLKLIYLPVVLASMVAFFGGLFVIGATITFWTVESIEAINILTYGGTEMMAYPMSIYPTWMRRFFTFVVPAIFLNYYPALYILGKPDPFNLPAWAACLSPVSGLAVLLAGLAFWQYGIRHYQSTGT